MSVKDLHKLHFIMTKYQLLLTTTFVTVYSTDINSGEIQKHCQ